MNSRSVRSRLLIASAVVAVLLLGVAWRVFDITGDIQRDGRLTRYDAVPGSIDAHKIRNAVAKDYRESLLSVITTSPEAALVHAKTGGEQGKVIADTLGHYQGTIIIDPATDSKNVSDFNAAWNDYDAKRSQMLSLSRQGKRDEAQRYSEQVVAPAYAQLAVLADTLVAYNDHNADALSGHIIEESGRIRTTVIVTVVTAGIGTILLLLNLIARRREENEHALQNQRFATALSLARTALWVRDFKNGKVEWSGAIDPILGYEANRFPRTIEGWLAAIHPDDLTRVKSAIENTRLINTRYEVEYRIARSDGTFIWVRDSGNVSVVGTDTGPVYGAIRDITERKRSEEHTALLEAQLRQAQKLEAIGTLAGGIAHDFNNILTGINGTAEMAIMDIADGGGESVFREPMETILRGSKRAASLVRQILTFCRQSEKSLEPVSLEQIINEVLSLMRSTVPANIEIVCEIEPDLPTILGDGTQIHQVLVNLCTNSVHAMKGTNGRLVLAVDSVNADEDFVTLHADLQVGRHIRLSVTDTGHGMSAETLKRIFEPFFTTKGAREGTGLGLSVVHGIIKEHSGGIYCYSHLAEGTTFHVYFPVSVAGSGFRTEESKTATPVGQGEHILVVDDEPEVQRAAANMLRRLGYLVSVASDCDSAIKMYEESPDRFDLVLTDMAMPNNTGLDLAKELIRIRPDVAVALMTGFAGNLNSATARKLGLRELILKPLTIDRLGRVVRRILDDSVLTPADGGQV